MIVARVKNARPIIIPASTSLFDESFSVSNNSIVNTSKKTKSVVS